MTTVPAGTSTSPMVVFFFARRKSTLVGLSKRSDSSMKGFTRLRSSRKIFWYSGRSQSTRSAELSSFVTVS